MTEYTVLQPDYETADGQIARFQLANGLRIVMMKSTVVPVVAVDLWYHVGSRNEEPGKSGFAHLFEHMMFEGSANVAKSEHMRLISEVGGTCNASTSKDRTNYFQVVPANQIKLALWLEADRMRSLAITDENFENQRDTVKEERRMRIDNAPYAPVFYEKLDDFAYQSWPYKHSIMGSMDDLDRASVTDVKAFHDVYYQPGNAVLAVVGDIGIQETLKIIKDYFGDIPSGPPIPPVNLDEPQQAAEKRMVWQDPFAPLPAVAYAYHTPAYGSEDYYSLEVVEKILCDGESSRLYRRFIERDRTLLHLQGGMDNRIGPGLFNVFGQLKPGVELKTVEAALEEEMDRICNQLLDEDELLKARNQFRADFINRLERNYDKADQLCFYTTYFDNPELIYTELDRLLQVTPEMARAAAQRYLTKTNRSVIEIETAGRQL